MKRLAFLALAIGLAAGVVVAQEAPTPAGPPGRGRGPATAPATPPMEARSDTVTTTGTLHPSGKAEMAYTATAGYLPLKDESEKLRANMFFVSYTEGAESATAPATQPTTLPQAAPGTTAVFGGSIRGGNSGVTAVAPAGNPPASNRPITFLFNGGPGAASVWLHLAVGPKRLDLPADGSAPVPPYRVVDNEFSWLPATDLVFVDPVNTGYSRAATPELAREFFGVQEDIAAAGEFIRLYLTKNRRWGSPVYLAGESYGTTRAAGLSSYLQSRDGLNVSGIVLISSVLNFEAIVPSEGNDLPFPLFLPSYAAVAWYHKKVPSPAGGLDALLKDAETFALGDYTAALAKGSRLSDDDKQKVAKRVADLTGLSADYVLASNLRVPPERFEKELLRTPTGGKVIGRYDGRLTGDPTDVINDSQDYDPSLIGFQPAYTAAFNEYVRATLKYENDLPYEVLSGRTQPWNYGSGANGFVYVGDDLRNAMTRNPHLRVMVCSGRFDLATPYFATDYTLAHLGLAPELQKNITQSYFPGGHMLYQVHEGLEKLYGEVNGFIGK